MWDSHWKDIKMIVKYLESEYGIAIGAKISEVGDVKWDEFAPIGQFLLLSTYKYCIELVKLG